MVWLAFPEGGSELRAVGYWSWWFSSTRLSKCNLTLSSLGGDLPACDAERKAASQNLECVFQEVRVISAAQDGAEPLTRSESRAKIRVILLNIELEVFLKSVLLVDACWWKLL